ncbi:hypothetical protein [Streptomyces sp. NPDC029721]|uniref:hypothetical protein n=1 Tax=unclassified Streptomyces TaxID=2593676 RepID=UPI0033D64116
MKLLPPTPGAVSRWQNRKASTAIVAAALAGLAVSGLVASQLSAQAASSRNPVGSQLECSGALSATFTPGIKDTTATVSTAVTGTFDNCTSPSGLYSNIKSAKVTGSASGTASCNGTTAGTATATATFYSGPHRTGTVIGTAIVSTTGTQTGKNDAADNTSIDQPTGLVTGGTLFPAHRVLGTAIPTSNVTGCSNSSPLTSATGVAEFDIALP